MKTIKPYTSTLIPEIIDAIKRGYDKNFVQHANGLLRCLSDPTKYYDFEEIKIDDFIICSLIPATLYLITTVDGYYKGSLLDFHDLVNY